MIISMIYQDTDIIDDTDGIMTEHDIRYEISFDITVLIIGYRL